MSAATPSRSTTPHSVTPTADWTQSVRFYEYSSAAEPRVPKIPFAVLPSSTHAAGPTRVAPFDLSASLQTDGPATTPNLLANFIHIASGDSISTHASATSQLFYVIRGSGKTSCTHGEISWSAGDLFVIPVTDAVDHAATSDAALYWVHDEPLLRYLGVSPTKPQFPATLFKKDRLAAELHAVATAPFAEMRNRRGILLGNEATPLTLTVTHTLWSLLNVLPAGVVQKPHRHNSVALDLCIDAGPKTYTMIGDTLDENKAVKNGIRADWLPGAAFVTPPGLWHSHHNESKQDALVLPIQDAGLCTYMRILDIQFASSFHEGNLMDYKTNPGNHLLSVKDDAVADFDSEAFKGRGIFEITIWEFYDHSLHWVLVETSDPETEADMRRQLISEMINAGVKLFFRKQVKPIFHQWLKTDPLPSKLEDWQAHDFPETLKELEQLEEVCRQKAITMIKQEGCSIADAADRVGYDEAVVRTWIDSKDPRRTGLQTKNPDA